MNKRSIINEISAKLAKLGVPNNGCYNLNVELPNGDKLAWVGYRQVMINSKIDTSLYRNKRFPLYSKGVDVNVLNLINSKL